MTTTSQSRGSDIKYIDNRWVHFKTGFAISDEDRCCLCGRIPGDGGIDPCILQIIKSLNQGGVETIASCCGHGRRPGNIILKDGREILICRDYKTARYVEKDFRQYLYKH